MGEVRERLVEWEREEKEDDEDEDEEGMINGDGSLEQTEGAERWDVMNGKKADGEGTRKNWRTGSEGQRAERTLHGLCLVFLGPGARQLACFVRLCHITQDWRAWSLGMVGR